MAKIKEDELLERVYEVFGNLSPVDFVEEVNRALGTDYVIGDIKWND